MTDIDTSDIVTGDRVRFHPDTDIRKWWHVIGRDENHIVAVRQAPFQPRGHIEYTVTGTLDHAYNGQGPGLVRSSLNTLGGGFNLTGRLEEGATEILDELATGRHELSMRRVIGVTSIEVKGKTLTT